MANFVISSSVYFIGGYEFSGDTTGITLTHEADAVENTTMTSGGKRIFLPGLKNFSFEHEGFFNAAASTAGIDGQHFTAVGVQDHVISVAQLNGTEGSIAYGFRGVMTNHNPSGSIGDMFALGASVQGTDPLVRGTIMANKTGVSSNPTNHTSFQLGQIAAGQNVYLIAHITAESNNATITVDIESDNTEVMVGPNNRGQIIFTGSVNQLLGKYHKGAAGPQTDDWWRITTSGTNTFSIFAFIGIL